MSIFCGAYIILYNVVIASFKQVVMTIACIRLLFINLYNLNDVDLKKFWSSHLSVPSSSLLAHISSATPFTSSSAFFRLYFVCNLFMLYPKHSMINSVIMLFLSRVKKRVKLSFIFSSIGLTVPRLFLVFLRYLTTTSAVD